MSKDRIKSIYSNYALVGSEIGNILFKKENNSIYFRNSQKSILNNTERRFDHLLKWIFDKKELLGVDLTVDVKNYFEELEASYEERDILNNKPISFSNSGYTINVNGIMLSNSLKIDKVKEIVFNQLSVNNITSVTGNFEIILEYSSDNILWKTYDKYTLNQGTASLNSKEVPTEYLFTNTRRISVDSHYIYFRIKLSGVGSITTKEASPFKISANGLYVVSERYNAKIDEETDIFVSGSKDTYLETTRSLLHTEGFFSSSSFYKRNQKQIVTLYISLSGGIKAQIIKETYTDNFISNIAVREADEKGFMIFESSDVVTPNISIPSQVKQLLYKNKDNYVNKRIIEPNTNFSVFGYKIESGIYKYDKNGNDLGKVVSKDLDKIQFNVANNIEFSKLLIENPIDSAIADASGKAIFKGKIFLSETFQENIENIINLIKNKKTFYKMSIILYSEYNNDIRDLVYALTAGKKTPQDVFLVCSNPNDSNPKNSSFNKMELGSSHFKNSILEALKNKVGFQFNSLSETINTISDFINESIERKEKFSLTNAVGFNIYDFTKASIDNNFYNKYGYYINYVCNNFSREFGYELFGTSKNNSMQDIVQYDIGTPFSATIDLTDVLDNATKDMNLETDDKGISFSITHNDNILWQYVVGEEIVEIYKSPKASMYEYSINNSQDEDDPEITKTLLKLKTNFDFGLADRGDNNFTLNVKNKNCITNSYVIDFIVDYQEPKITFEVHTEDKINEVGYVGNKNTPYTKDNFFECGISSVANYEFKEGEYSILISHKDIPEYKIERELIGTWQSKIHTIHIDDAKNIEVPDQKLKFGDWECSIVRKKYNHKIAKFDLNIPLNIEPVLDLSALPVEDDFEDYENNGLQQGKDVYIKFKFKNSNYFKKIRDFIYFCKEVRFIINGVNFTASPENFTYLDKTPGINSLQSVTNHLSEELDNRNEMRWMISGISESNSNKFLLPVANLAGDEKKTKTIRLDFVLFNDEIIDTANVKIGQTGVVKAPIVCGSDEHFEKLKYVYAKSNRKNVDELTPEEIVKIKEQLQSLGKTNYDNQQIIKDSEVFVFYSDLLEIKFDFGICEYFTISQANSVTDMIPITRDGMVRYVIDKGGIDENSKGTIAIKGYVKLSDGLTISSEERNITFYRKKLPSLIETGDDYTKYVNYEIDKETNYYNLKTVIQSKIELENLNENYSSEWIDHIEVELVDVDKQTVIAHGPDIKFYDGFVPQRFIFDSGLTEEDINSITQDERFPIEKTKKYKELEIVLNEKIFSKNKHLGQTFYLRFKAVEIATNIKNEKISIKGRETFYPIIFSEKLKELVIVPASGIIVKIDNYEEFYYTYKNKVSVILESNNAEYFMYRTDRSASFQKVYPKQIGYTRIVKLTISTYDVGNHILEVKQKAEGETESNVYNIIIEKINAVNPPKITGNNVVDENPKWTIHPMDNAFKYYTSIITNEKEHSKKTIDALQYEMDIQPDYYLENGYHILQAISYDKIGNSSETSYYITRKIGRPIASEINGEQKTSEDFIEWTWKSQYHEGIREYIIEINGTEKNTIPASLDGFNEYVLRHFQGKDISDGTYEIRVWAVNELGNRSYVYSSFLTEKGTKIKELVCEFYKFKGDYTNKLEARILTEDKAIKNIEYEIFKNDNGEIVSVTGVMSSNQKQLPFLMSNGNRVELENGEYYFAFRGVNYIDEKTEYVRIPFIYRYANPEKPFIYYLKSVKTTNPVFFVKESGNEMISAIEIKVGDHNFEKIVNNVWRPNYSLNLGTNNVVIRVTDYAGNQSEYGDFIEITAKGINQFQEDYMADMNNPVVKLDFNLPEMSNFGHINFRIQQEKLGIDAIINILNANTLELPLTSSNQEKFPDGTYRFVIKLYDERVGDYDYIADYFSITIDSNKPTKPYFLNSGYDGIEYNKQYTKNRNPKWLWQTRNITNLKEYIVDLFVLDEKENTYVEYGNKQFSNYSTALIGQFQSPDEFKDGTYKLVIKSIGLNNLESDSESFTMVIKNSLPKPPKFDLKKMINRKYENRNSNISWIWEDINTGNDVLVNYKVKINQEEFSDELGDINHYEETRTLKDGPNSIMVIGRDKAGNWSTANEISANNFGPEYMKHTKIIDTVIPEKMSEEDIIINILDSMSFETLFRNDNKAEEYFLFELITLDQNNEEVYFVKGNTLPLGTTDVYFMEKQVIPGVNLGVLNDKQGYCEIRTTEDNKKVQKYLYFTNLLNNDYYLRVYGVDYAGNISEALIKKIVIQDLTKLKPTFILPKNVYTNNSTIIFQWVLNEPNIIKWEYQLITPYGNSSADLTNDSKWKSLTDNIFSINNIPKLVAGNDADGDYTLYVRAVFKETVIQAGTGLEVNKKSDIGHITVHLDRKIPQGVLFTNKTYTTDNSVLRWTWNYTGEGDIADGVYVSFNPNLPIEEWEQIVSKNIYESFKERQDGKYTLYVRTFDKAGNINNTIFENTITLDRIPPFAPIINGGSNIYTNTIPTIQWENDLNYFKYTWVVLTLDEFNNFKKVYDKLVNEDYYTLTNNDWSYLFSKDDYNIESVQEELRQFNFKKNDAINSNFILINTSNGKNGIDKEGEYVFVLTGYDENHNWAEEFEYQFITYDITAPDLNSIKFIEPTFVITEERRPIWKWRTPTDVVKCTYSLEKNGYNDGSITGDLFKKADKHSTYLEYSFKPDYNLTQGNYRLIVDCYDASKNSVQVSKSIIVEGETTSLESEFFDIILPGINNRVRIKMNKYSDVYTIVEIDLNSNSVLTYKKTNDPLSGYKIYEFGKTELELSEEYDFNITSYTLKF